MAPKPKRPDYTGSLASYKESVADKPKGLDLPSPNQVVNWASGIVASGRTAAGQTQPLTPGDQGLRTLGQGISLANTMLNPYANTTRKALGAAVNRDRQSLTALSKSAALDLAITGGAAVAAKGVQLGINAAANSGIPARIGNKITGQTVLVHGSPVKGLKEIKPFVSNNVISNEYPGKAAVFGYKPNEIKDVRRLRYDVANYTKVDSKIADDATIYITKVKNTETAPAKNLVPKGVTTLPGSYAGSTPLKVVDSVSIANKASEKIEKELLQKIVKAGGKISKAPPATTRRA